LTQLNLIDGNVGLKIAASFGSSIATTANPTSGPSGSAAPAALSRQRLKRTGAEFHPRAVARKHHQGVSWDQASGVLDPAFPAIIGSSAAIISILPAVRRHGRHSDCQVGDP
jgi:hypothetical protein